MTKNRRRVRIPKDIKNGDVLVLRDGKRRKVYAVFPDEVHCEGPRPGGFNYDGGWWLEDDYGEHKEWDVVAIERTADLSKPPKPPLADKDAVWLMGLAVLGQTIGTETSLLRLRAIARRLNGGKAVRG